MIYCLHRSGYSLSGLLYAVVSMHCVDWMDLLPFQVDQLVLVARPVLENPSKDSKCTRSSRGTRERDAVTPAQQTYKVAWGSRSSDGSGDSGVSLKRSEINLFLWAFHVQNNTQSITGFKYSHRVPPGLVFQEDQKGQRHPKGIRRWVTTVT